MIVKTIEQTESGVKLGSNLVYNIPDDDYIKLHRYEPLMHITHLGEEGARDTLHIRHSNVRVDMNTSRLIYISKIC